jgi:hypothetical protein
MEKSPFWKADSPSASQEILRLLWTPKVHNNVDNSPPSPSVTFRNIPSFDGEVMLALAQPLRGDPE